MKVRARPYNLQLRLKLLAGVLGFCGVVLVGRAAQMQLLNKDFYQQQGDQRFLRDVPIATSRGMIMDRNGEPLAVSTPSRRRRMLPVARESALLTAASASG